MAKYVIISGSGFDLKVEGFNNLDSARVILRKLADAGNRVNLVGLGGDFSYVCIVQSYYPRVVRAFRTWEAARAYVAIKRFHLIYSLV